MMIFLKVMQNKSKTFIAYSMTGVVKYRTNFLFNLGKEARNGKTTVINMY